MIFLVLRIVILGLLAWFFWRLIATLLASRRPSKSHQQDEWTEVLDGISDLPETTHTGPLSQSQPRMLPEGDLIDHARSQDNIELLLVHKAEAALALLKASGQAERLVAYQEIMTYEKLCNTANISAETWKKIDGIRRQASALMESTEQC